ncbi:MAG: hypothetical protein AAGG68_15080 [Bacteroidota bacterium]
MKYFVFLLLILFSCSDQKRCEEIKELYSDEKVKLVHKYPNCNDKDTYIRIHYYPNGQKSSYGKFINNLKEGEFKTWYENGQLSAVWETKNGRSHGRVACYHEDGNLEREAMIEGEKGYFKFYSEDGELKLEGVLLNDSIKSGIWIEYYENGNPEYKWQYKNGLLEGRCSTYYKNNRLESILVYSDNSLKDTIVIYDSLGNELYAKND